MTSAVSILAYRSIVDLEERQARVLAMIAAYPNMSRNDIARVAKMDPANVSNRISELLRDGRVMVIGTKKDRLTGKTLRIYAPTPEEA